MNILILFLAFVVGGVSWSCPKNSLRALVPQTQQTHCIEKWAPNTLVLVAERDCIPCADLINRTRKETNLGKEAWKLLIVWIELDQQSCLLNALKSASFGTSLCAKKKEVEDQWSIPSTPVVFFESNGKKQIQIGNVDKNKVLPWNAP
jgi:thioredoxin-related protein